MTPTWPEVAHLYLGCKYRMRYLDYEPEQWTVPSELTLSRLESLKNDASVEDVQLFLRPLSSMTEEEMIQVLTICNSTKDNNVSKEEIGEIEIFKNDGGLMVDDNVVIGCNYSIRCFEGQLCIMDCGSVSIHDVDADFRVDVYNQPKILLYLLSLHMDLFGLIQSGEAIDSKTLSNQ